MNLDVDTTRSLVKEGYCISLSESKRIQSLIPDAEALEEWKRKQKKKTNECHGGSGGPGSLIN